MEMNRMVLVIDDDPVVLESLMAFLEVHGLQVIAVARGREGVEVARARQPDLILSNFSMPDMDGLGVLECIRRDPQTREIPFVFFTTQGTHSVRQKCLEMGADAFLDKGFDGAELIDVLLRLLGEPAPQGRSGPKGATERERRLSDRQQR